MTFLNIDFKPGFIIYKNGYGPVWVCPHAGPAVKTTTNRDENSDVVASLCWTKTGGSLVISSVPRKRLFGIDFNRDVPPEDTSIMLADEFSKDLEKDRLKRYRELYAWASVNKSDYKNRMKIYESFWKTVSRLGNVIIFVHREYASLKNFPSIMEIITYRGEGVNKDIVKTIIKKINKKYDNFLKRISNHYKHTILLEEMRFVDRIKETLSTFDADNLNVYQKERMIKNLKMIKKYADKEILERLKDNFTERNFISAVKSVLKNDIIPTITLENNFSGERAIKMKKPLFINKKNIVMEIESSSFINYWYPETARDIIVDLLNDLISVDMYKKMGIKQTQILKFVKK